MSDKNISISKIDVKKSGEFTIDCLVRNLHLTNIKGQDNNGPQKPDTKTCGGKKSETKKTSKKATQAPGLSELMSKTKGLATSFAGAHSREVTPHAAEKPAEPGSQSLPSPVIAQIKDSIISSLPKLAEAFKKAGWDKRFSEDDVQKALENMVTNGEKSSEDFCKINGQVSHDGKLNLMISVNFFNVQNIKTEEVKIKGSLGVAINGSTLNINGVGLEGLDQENWEDGLGTSCSQNQPIITRL